MKTASEDLEQRTLSPLRGNLARLIYLASTRDYNSGSYHHEGLADRFGAEQAQHALQKAHEAMFVALGCLSLKELVEELELYLRTSREPAIQLISTWQELEPYRIAVPKDADPTLVQLFLSNLRIALGVLSFRRDQSQTSPSAASPPRSLDR